MRSKLRDDGLAGRKEEEEVRTALGGRGCSTVSPRTYYLRDGGNKVEQSWDDKKIENGRQK